MSAALMQACVNDTSLQKYVHYLSVKIHLIYPRFLDVDDAKNDLWEAVFKAIQDRFSPEKSLFHFAKRVLFSNYGTMIGRGNLTLLMNERVTDSDHGLSGYVDRSFEKIESLFTLDQIEHDLEEEASRSRRYRLVIKTFRHLRTGITLKQIYDRLSISPSHVYHLRDLMQDFCGKYQENVHYS